MDHEFKIHMLAISEERGPVTLCIKARLSGDYQLPHGVLVSGVYWLSLHPFCREVAQKVIVTVHLMMTQTSSFVTAQCTQKKLHRDK